LIAVTPLLTGMRMKPREWDTLLAVGAFVLFGESPPFEEAAHASTLTT
jgi:hypothetical protein